MSTSASSQPSEESAGSVVESLLEVTSGAAVVVTGMLAGMALMLVGRGLFTRTYAPGEYGLFSLAFTVASILTVVATLGLWSGITRQIAYYGAAESEDGLTAGSIVSWGLVASAAAGVVVAVALFALAEPLAAAFGHPEYALAFRVAAVAIPSLALIRIATAIFRGFSRTRERVAFQELLQKGSFPLLLGAVVLFGWGVEPALYAFPASLAVTAVAYLAYVVRDDPAGFRGEAGDALRRLRDGYDLLAFSVPLMFASLLIQIMSWTDILMLGYFASAAVVGVYDAVRPLVKVVSIVWGSMIFLYTPAVSAFHAADEPGSVRRAYFALTKWFTTVTFPLVVLFVLFPSLVLETAFGPAYTDGATALRILAVAYFLGNVMGPNGATLTALGRTRVVMWANFAAAVANVLLNLALVPRFGIVGAAVATAGALVARNCLRVVVLYRISGAHSFKRPMLVPMAVTAAATFAAGPVAGDLVTRSWHLLPAFVAALAVYLGTMAAAGHVSEADRELVAAVRRWRPAVS